MARSDRLPRDPALPRDFEDPKEAVRRLTSRLSVLLTLFVDSVNLLIDGYLLGVGSLFQANEESRSKMAVLRGAPGARDRIFWVRKKADGTYDTPYLACGDLRNILHATDSVDFGNVPSGSVESTTITVSGAQPGDPVVCSFTGLGANNILISAHVQAADTVRVVVYNISGATWSAGAGTLRVMVLQGGE